MIPKNEKSKINFSLVDATGDNKAAGLLLLAALLIPVISSGMWLIVNQRVASGGAPIDLYDLWMIFGMFPAMWLSAFLTVVVLPIIQHNIALRNFANSEE